LLAEDGLKIMTQLFNNLHETGEWSKGVIEVTAIALKEKPKGTECSDHHTYSKARILRRRTERRLRMYL
jgi:hypothetical protein